MQERLVADIVCAGLEDNGSRNAPSSPPSSAKINHVVDQNLQADTLATTKCSSHSPPDNLTASFELSAPTSTNFLSNQNSTPCSDSLLSLTAKLNNYKYLDDYEYYRGERLKKNALGRFSIIMQSLKAKYKNCAHLALDNDDSDDDVLEEPGSEFSNFNQILKRHRRRFKQSPSLHHRH